MDIFENMTIGERLRYMIELKETSQSALARQCGVTQAAISNIVNSSKRSPSAATLISISQALNCSADWLINGKGDPVKGRALNAELKAEVIQKFEKLSPPDQMTVNVVMDSMISRYSDKK